MREVPSVVTCRFARETLRLPYPHWINAERVAWTCLRGPEPEPLDDPEICRVCPRWLPRRLRPEDAN